MQKNISNIANNSSAYRNLYSHGNKKSGNVDKREVTEKPQNVTTTNNPLIVNISDEGLRASQKDKKDELTKMMNEHSYLKEQSKAMQKQISGQAEAMKIRATCMKIAMRIMKGDEVAKEDIKYLQKHDMGLYQKALLMKAQNDNPKKHKRISKDEKAKDTNEASDRAGSGMQSPTGGIGANASSEMSMETSSGSATSSETE